MGFFYETAEALFYISLYRKIKNLFNYKKYKRIEPFKVGWMSGACMVLKKLVFDEVKGFNPDYFVNYEDLDFCIKIINANY